MNQDPTKILLTCLGYASEAHRAKRLAQVSAVEWQEVVELAWHQAVAPMLYHRLKQMDISIPGELAEKLRQGYWKNTRRNMRLYQELGKLLQRLNDKNIAVIALKGADLAEAVYKTIGLRRIGDVDLLVKKDDLQQVEKELLSLGYKPEEYNRLITQDNYHFLYQQPHKGLAVEIHWLLVAPNLPFHIEIDDVWSRAMPFTLAQAPTWRLSPIDLLLYLCVHTAKHTHQIQLYMLCDIGEVIEQYEPEMDWQAIGFRARQWGITRAVYVMLRLAQELLEVAVPADWLARIEPAGFNEGFLILAHQQIDKTSDDEVKILYPRVARLWGLKGLGEKIALIRDILFPSRESIAAMYPAPVDSWRIYPYYLVHIKDMAGRHARSLWRLMRGHPKTREAANLTTQLNELSDWLLSN